MAAVLWLAWGAAAEGAESYRTVRVLHFSDLEGELGSLACAREERSKQDFSGYLKLISDERESGPAFVVASGNILGDSPFLEFLLSQGESGWVTLTSVLGPAEPVAMVPGPGEFSLPSGMFLEFLPRIDNLGLRWGAANVSCVTTGGACEALSRDPIIIHVVEGIRFALVPLTAAGIGAAVPPENVEGLKFESAVERGSELALRARKELRADVVVAVVNLEVESGTTFATMEFSQRVRGVDVVVAGGMVSPGEVEPAVALARMGGSSTLLAGSPRAPAGLGVLTLRLRRKGATWNVEDATTAVRRTSSFQRVPEVAALLSQVTSEFCSLTGRFLGDGRVDPPMDRDTFMQYVMEIMRRHFGADVAVLSSDSLKMDRDRVLSGSVGAGFLFKAFARHQVVVLDVSGQDLNAFAGSWLDPARESLRGELKVLGVTRDDDGTVKVNNRPINVKRSYLIATTDFLASGSKGYLKTLLAPSVTETRQTSWFLRELVQRFLDRNLYARTEADTSVGLENFDSLWTCPLWEFAWSATGSGSNVAIDNGGGYGETQLTRSRFTGIKAEGQSYVDVSTRDHRWSDFFKIQYGRARTGDSAAAETQDLITQELLYSWTRVRNVWGDEKPYIPVPVAKGKVETEFSRAEGSDFHHLEVTGAAGVEWPFGRKAGAGLAYGVRRELLDSTDALHPGVQFYYQVNTLPVYEWGPGRTIVVDSRFELFYSDWTTSDTLKGIGGAKVSAAVLGPLSFTAGVDVFLFREGAGDLAWSLDSTAGVSLSFDTASQTF